MKTPTRTLFMLFFACTLFSACNSNDDTPTITPPAEEMTLYQKLGGSTMVADPANEGAMIEQGRLGLRSVVDSTIFVIAGDDRLIPYFEALLAEVGNGDLTGFAALSMSLTDFFAAATGSENITYNGLNMVDAHDPNINPRMALPADDQAFDAFIEDVVEGAVQNSVPEEIILEVGALIETLRGAVVQA